MPYNYFCCRKHSPPVQVSVPQPANLPNTYASPACPQCGKFMERYDTGLTPTDPRPVPPPEPTLTAIPKLSNQDVVICSGSGMNPGHGKVTWEISRNAAKMDIIIELKLGEYTGGAWSSQQTFKMVDGLLDTSQGGSQEDWWLRTPTPRHADREVWHTIDLKSLVGATALGSMPPTIEIGVKLGNARFGLIHLLAGHAQAVRNVGPFTTATTDDRRDDVYRTVLCLQAGMGRFAEDAIKLITYDATADKFLVKGSHSGLIVVTRTNGSARYAITTIYNANTQPFGNVVYEN